MSYAKPTIDEKERVCINIEEVGAFIKLNPALKELDIDSHWSNWSNWIPSPGFSLLRKYVLERLISLNYGNNDVNTCAQSLKLDDLMSMLKDPSDFFKKKKDSLFKDGNPCTDKDKSVFKGLSRILDQMFRIIRNKDKSEDLQSAISLYRIKSLEL